MEAPIKEVLDLLIRWLHLVAGIMWIGNSMLFNWLDRNLVVPPGRGPEFLGEIWMVHSGGFYQVEKKFLAPHQMPPVLHWFKWQAYTTWLSGFGLLLLVYYAGGYLVDPGVARLGPGAAAAVGLGALAAAWLGYDRLWRSRLAQRPRLATALWLGGLLLLVIALNHLLSGRAAYIHVGAMLGTLMAGNVFFHIIPSQHQLVAATREGRPQDAALSAHAKQRSIHNNYMTFPVLFTMLSNHFPSTYGGARGWLVLLLLMVAGAAVRHCMNIRFWYPRWHLWLGGTVAVAAGLLLLLLAPPRPPAPAQAGGRASFATVQRVIRARCVSCHAAQPTDEVWRTAPGGVRLDTPEEIRQHAERIKVRAVLTRTMPFQNKTGITQEERDLLGQWIYEGAQLAP